MHSSTKPEERNLHILMIENGSDVNDAKIQRFINTLRYSITPQAEFSSMAIDLLSGWPHL